MPQKYTEARKAGNRKWDAENLDRLSIALPKGMKEKIKAAADKHGVSVNALVNYAIDEILPSSDISMYQKQLDKRNFFEWYNTTANDEEKRLVDSVFEYSEEYFADFRFENGSAVSDFVEMCEYDDDGQSFDSSDPFSPHPDLLYFDQTVLKSLEYKVKYIDDETAGMYSYLTHTLTISPEYLEKKDVLLHELIHIYEGVLDKLPKYYHDVLLYSLLKKLRNNIPDLDDRIILHTHLYYGAEITNSGGDHDILFFLKSLDLDLACGYPLGTVCGYGRDEQ